jgi:hypothetical protein
MTAAMKHSNMTIKQSLQKVLCCARHVQLTLQHAASSGVAPAASTGGGSLSVPVVHV